MKKIITSIALISAFTASNAQTTATDFTAPDCTSASHTLFTELNNGKVIVLVWVMPCAMCVDGAKAVSAAVQSYATSNPGKVMAYLSDDMGDQTCTDLNTWMTSNSVGTNFTVFGNAGNKIDESNYGGSGMPHVVVLGGSDHKVYFNKKGTAANDVNGLKSAINAAMIPTGINNIANDITFAVVPNPVNDQLTIQYGTAIRSVTITAMNGQLIKEEAFNGGKMNPSVQLSGVAKGLYLVKVIDVAGNTGTHKIVKE